MALVKSDSGRKVGWETYDNEEEARSRSESAKREAWIMASRGHDFGYCQPGEVKKVEDEDLWVVTIP